MLNVEIYETLLDLNYKKQNKVILNILKTCIKNHCFLIIRRKPGWTNFTLLKKELCKEFKKDDLKNLVFCSDNFTINEYFSEVSIILLQGSTAILSPLGITNLVFFLVVKI